MDRKLALGFIAAASLIAAALAPTGASAHGWGGGWHHHSWGHYGFGFGPVVVAGPYDGGGCLVRRRVMTPYGYRWRTFNVCY